MDLGEEKTRPDRQKTDESLRAEREKADGALAIRLVSIEENADSVLDRAREDANAVLNAARDKADQILEERTSRAPTLEAIARERAQEDKAIQRERAATDESLRHEREAHARALARLLPIERDKTDRHLLTERVRSDEALAKRDDFLVIVSHDLRNLLNGIVLSATVLSETISENEEGAQNLEGAKRIQHYAARMNRLIGDLVDVASIESAKFTVVPVRADLTALVAEATEMFRPSASAKGVSLEAELPERPLLSDFDGDRMLQVLANLLTNAIKFTAEGGKITVRAERVEDEVRLAVEDTGAGIPGDMLDAVFERFWQVSENDRRGLGLGLYISRCVVLAHGGKIWVESKLGEGSQFYLTLPAEARRDGA